MEQERHKVTLGTRKMTILELFRMERKGNWQTHHGTDISRASAYRSPKQPIWRHPLKGLLFITKVDIICAIISETFPDTWRPFAKMEEGRRISVDPPSFPHPFIRMCFDKWGLEDSIRATKPPPPPIKFFKPPWKE